MSSRFSRFLGRISKNGVREDGRPGLPDARPRNLVYEAERLSGHDEDLPAAIETPSNRSVRLFDHFLVIGLAAGDAGSGRGSGRPNARILYTFPENVPVPYQDLARFCFPDGVTTGMLRKSHSTQSLLELLFSSNPAQAVQATGHVFALTVSDVPSFMPMEESEEPIISKAMCNSVAPRCFVFLSRLPYFELHFAILERMLWLEHLARVSSPLMQQLSVREGVANSYAILSPWALDGELPKSRDDGIDPIGERCRERLLSGHQVSVSSISVGAPRETEETPLRRVSAVSARIMERSMSTPSASSAAFRRFTDSETASKLAQQFRDARIAEREARESASVASCASIAEEDSSSAVADLEERDDIVSVSPKLEVSSSTRSSEVDQSSSRDQAEVSSPDLSETPRLVVSGGEISETSSISSDDSMDPWLLVRMPGASAGIVKSVSVHSSLSYSGAQQLDLRMDSAESTSESVTSVKGHKRASSLQSSTVAAASVSVASSTLTAIGSEGGVRHEQSGTMSESAPAVTECCVDDGSDDHASTSETLEILGVTQSCRAKNPTLQYLSTFNMRSPSSMSRLVFQPLPEISPVIFSIPSVAEEHIGIARFAFPILFRSLRLDLILAMVSSMLLERRTIVLSADLRVLSGVLLSTIPLIRPLIWVGVFVPVLPTSLPEVLEAPVPYAVGMSRLPPGAVVGPATVVIDASKQELVGADLPRVPRYRDLVEKLKPISDKFRRVKGKDDQLVYEVLKIFTEFHQSLVGNVPQYTLTNVTNAQRPVSIFLRENFIEAFIEADRRFVAEFVESQQFAAHCDRQLAQRTAEAATASAEYITCLE